jgi:hypothetical protein
MQVGCIFEIRRHLVEHSWRDAKVQSLAAASLAFDVAGNS